MKEEKKQDKIHPLITKLLDPSAVVIQ
jgi:hypothetical protein